MPRLSVAWVILQRVPPDMRILIPGLRFFSSRSVRRPRSAARLAASNPAAPAPMTATSQETSDMSLARPAILLWLIMPVGQTVPGEPSSIASTAPSFLLHNRDLARVIHDDLRPIPIKYDLAHHLNGLALELCRRVGDLG